MNRLAPGIALVAGLVGCASPPVPGAMPGNDRQLTPDTQRMAIIERQAVRFGVKIIWVNPPLKSLPNPG